MEMRTAHDFSPLYRSAIGVDRMVGVIETAMRSEGDRNYPPYDIEKIGDDAYPITLAAAGFRPEELELVAQPNLLVVAGRKGAGDETGRNYLHRGIAAGNFERRFELADYVVVKSARHADGLLSIELVREVPEALKPRRIEIGAAASSPEAERLQNHQPERRAA
jgi:molecular chaperone IbpA